MSTNSEAQPDLSALIAERDGLKRLLRDIAFAPTGALTLREVKEAAWDAVGIPNNPHRKHVK